MRTILCKDPADILAASSSLFSLAALSPPVPAYPVCGLACDLARYGEGSHYRAGVSSAATAAVRREGEWGGVGSPRFFSRVCMCVCVRAANVYLQWPVAEPEVFPA